ncbi:GTPase Obg [Spirochaetia bacterium]|nr:GTPase Obg [Spirochaetia bacterium]
MQKFADEALIEVSSGKGGNGCVAFRREKYVPRGGPSGGDGGRGGDVIFEVRRNLRTLSHLRYTHSFKAENGRDGEGRQRNGRNGEDVLIPLPPGTILKDPLTGELIRDFGRAEGRFVFLKGGNGGWGNVHFKSSVNQAPHKALPGKPGEYRSLTAELQIMADVGLVGFPNAGKSSLLDRYTNARPKIAPYPFTTKIPNLGVLTLGAGSNAWESRDIIIADIPGLIEGASRGAGLGHRFLKHISRAAALVFLIDLSGNSAPGEKDHCSCLEAFDILYRELETFSPGLTKKKRLICGSKLDLEGTTEALEQLRQKYPDEKVLGISVFSGEGLAELAAELGILVNDSAAAAVAAAAVDSAAVVDSAAAAADGASAAVGGASAEDFDGADAEDFAIGGAGG